MKKKEMMFLSEEEKRIIKIGAKVTLEENENIKSRAKKCGMTVSRYIRESALGYKIYYPLSHEEKDALANVSNVRVDLLKFWSAFKGLSASERKVFFRSEETMFEWIKIIDDIAEKLQDFLNKVYVKSRR